MTRQRVIVTSAALIAVLACGPATAAKLYKWVDADGNVTYSQQKPPDVQAESMEVKVGGPSDSEAQEQLESLTDKADAALKDRQFAATASAEQAERDERIKKNCETARENKRILESAPRVQDTAADGTPYFVDDSTRAARLATAEDQIRQFCQ